MWHLHIEGLGKEFRLALLQGRRVVALRGIEIEIEQGTFLALLGASGAGKSTLLRCIYRTYLPSQGHVWYRTGGPLIDLATADERTVLSLRRSDIGYVSQFFKPMPRVSAVDWVASPLVERGLGRSEARARAGDLLHRLNIRDELWDSFPVLFSGGEQQRINLARALIAPRRLLLLDEPTASLDPANQRAVLQLLADRKEQGTTMIGVFHNVEAFTPLIDRYCLMEDGTIRREWRAWEELPQRLPGRGGDERWALAGSSSATLGR